MYIATNTTKEIKMRQRTSFRTLVLNADGRPLTIISWKRAITLLAEERVQQLDFYAGHKIHDTKGRAYPVPAVVMKTQYVRRDYRHAPFCKKNVFLRDDLTCQYCGDKCEVRDLTFDHVVPRSKWDKSKGSPTCWENIVTSCVWCNRVKGDKSCEQAKMFPINKPTRPDHGELFLGISPWKDKIPKEWTPYLQYLPRFKSLQHASEVAET